MKWNGWSNGIGNPLSDGNVVESAGKPSDADKKTAAAPGTAYAKNRRKNRGTIKKARRLSAVAMGKYPILPGRQIFYMKIVW